MSDGLQARLDELNGEGLEVPVDASPVEFLQAIYRDPRQPMHRRLKAAIEAAPICHPQLKATAVILGSDFATRLEAAVNRSNAARLIEAQSIGTSSISD